MEEEIRLLLLLLDEEKSEVERGFDVEEVDDPFNEFTNQSNLIKKR